MVPWFLSCGLELIQNLAYHAVRSSFGNLLVTELGMYKQALSIHATSSCRGDAKEWMSAARRRSMQKRSGSTTRLAPWPQLPPAIADFPVWLTWSHKAVLCQCPFPTFSVEIVCAEHALLYVRSGGR